MEQIAHLLNEEPKKKKIITGDPNTFISIMNKIFDGKVTVPTPNDKTDSDITFYPISKNAGTSQAFSQILSAPNEELQRRLTSQLIQELQAETNEGLMGLFGLEFKGYEISKGRSEIDKVWHTIISTLEIKDTEKFITFIQ